jgi:hypothetical protein
MIGRESMIRYTMLILSIRGTYFADPIKVGDEHFLKRLF